MNAHLDIEPISISETLPINSVNLKKEKNKKTSLDLQDVIPKWAAGNVQVRDHYYKLHQETWIDHLMRWIACRLGVIVHGELNQKQLEEKLQKFDIEKLLVQGPYFNSSLSTEAQNLIRNSLLPLERVVDVHLHNLGYDEGNYLNPSISARGVASWMNYFKFLVVRYACGIDSPIGSTEEARKRIHLYTKHFPKLHGVILPIHKAISKTGQVDWKHTDNFLKNKSAQLTAQKFDSPTSKLCAATSIHPFDPKWQHKLHKAHQQGIRLIKWMPPQSIKPDSEEFNDFYKALAERGMVLIAHSGPEHALPCSPEWEDFGNPLRFRTALQLGVNVILAHCGHKDMIPDLDDSEHKKVPGYELFARLAREAHANQWKGKLYGDLAAVPTHFGPDFIKKLLEFSQEPGFRYIYGSDYPYTNLIAPGKDAYKLMAAADLLDPKFVAPLQEIRNWNPLLANFVCTRYLSLKTKEGKLSFPSATFTGHFEDGPLDEILK